MASCSPDGQSANPTTIGSNASVPAENGNTTPASKAFTENPAPDKSAKASPSNSSEATTSTNSSTTKMKKHELLAFFKPSDADIYATCNDEKGPSDDYFNGKPIPMDLVNKYELYQFNMSPPLRLKYRLPNPLVTFNAGNVLSYQDYQILLYTVGIGMESEDAPVDEGVDSRALVINAAGEITGNYFIAGFVRREGREEESVCRKIAFKGDEIVLTLISEESTNNPSHLRLELEETRDLQ